MAKSKLNLKMVMPLVSGIINQLPVSAARWQFGSQVCIVPVIFQKISKLFITQQPLKLEKNITLGWKGCRG
jgi:hypothetical protein